MIDTSASNHVKLNYKFDHELDWEYESNGEGLHILKAGMQRRGGPRSIASSIGARKRTLVHTAYLHLHDKAQNIVAVPVLDEDPLEVDNLAEDTRKLLQEKKDQAKQEILERERKEQEIIRRKEEDEKTF